MAAKDLKNALLQEAVQGKLVPQIASDGNAKDLLEEIRKEKAKLVKEGKIKKNTTKASASGRALPEITEEDIPFDIPENWCWCRLSEICTKLVDGDHNPPAGLNEKTDYLMLSSRNINNDKLVDLELVRYLSKDIFEKENERTNAQKGDILFTSVGTLGRSCVFDGSLNICFQRSVSILKTLIYNFYLKYCLDSGYIQNYVISNATGTAQKGFYLNQLAELLIPLPPLAEQKRIVAAIEKFMPLIEEYGKKEKELKTFNEQIGTLTKKAILQEAVQGKLVPQIVAEGNAKDLLEEIKKEKAKLIKEGKIKKEKPLPEITEDEIPFDIPESWCYIHPSDIGYFSSGKTPKSTEIRNKGSIPYFKVSDMNNEGNELYMKKVINYLENDTKYKLFPKNTIIYPKNGGAVFTNKKRILITDSLVDLNTGVFVPFDGIDFKYFYILFSSIDFKQYYKGTALPTVDLEAVQNIVWALPPLAEQKRIISAIEKLLPLCEKFGS